MTRPREPWTTLDLELYRDDQLGAARRNALAADLRADPTLRRRLAAVHRVDEVLRGALLDPTLGHRSAAGHGRPGSRWWLAAASVLLMLSGTWWYLFLRPVAIQGGAADAMPAADRPLAGVTDYEAIRVVFSFPVPATTRDGSARPAARAGRSADAARTAAGTRRFLSRLDRALREGRLQDSLLMLKDSSQEDSRTAYRHIGELIRSAASAEQILNRLSPREQLAVCSEWAVEPRLRPVVFSRLRRLADESGLSDEVQRVVFRFAEQPALRSWLRGYQLVERNAAAALTPG
ncbi:MAG: hypothetical protein ACE5EX_03810 [Phycisphaerae bacterium]